MVLSRCHILLFLLLSGYSISANDAFQPQKRALIIAISEYDEKTGWPAINAHNDPKIIREALLYRGFREENIIVLAGRLTATDILSAIDQHLTVPSQAGDVVYFHFSGHGQQVADDNGDEPDGLDEALVPFDAPMTNKYELEDGSIISYNGEKHLTDDILGEELAKLRAKLGPEGNVLVVIDACHSGTATRGQVLARGAGFPNVPEDFFVQRAKTTAPSFFSMDSDHDEKAMAHMVVFSGSGASELNYEYIIDDSTAMGSLSYAFSRALIELPEDVSYRHLFENIKSQMRHIAPRQNPQMEGTADQVIFGGALTPAPSHIRVSRKLSETKVIINAGALMGLHIGQKIYFLQPDSKMEEEGKIIAEGEVTAVENIRAVVSFTSIYQKDAIEAAWVYPDLYVSDWQRVTVRIIAEKQDSLLLAQYLLDIPGIHISPTLASLELKVNQPENSKLEIRTSDDVLLLSYDLTDLPAFLSDTVNKKAIANTLQNYARARFLRGIHIPSERISAGVEIILLKQSATGFSEQKRITLSQSEEDVEIPEGSFIRFRIKNQARRKIHYALLEISPEDEIAVLFPSSRTTAAEHFLAPYADNMTNSPVFQLHPPHGTYQLKLIISLEPLSKHALPFTLRGIGTEKKEVHQSWQRILQACFPDRTPATRSAEDQVFLDVDDLAIYDFFFRLTPN